jgi:hypothetical protein
MAIFRVLYTEPPEMVTFVAPARMVPVFEMEPPANKKLEIPEPIWLLAATEINPEFMVIDLKAFAAESEEPICDDELSNRIEEPVPAIYKSLEVGPEIKELVNVPGAPIKIVPLLGI